MTFKLFPKPRIMRVRNDLQDLSRAAWIQASPSLPDRLLRHLVAFSGELRPMVLNQLNITRAAPTRGEVLLKVETLGDNKLRSQGYRLVCNTRGITLNAADEAGAFYGLLSLRQILGQTGITPPSFYIEDSPDFATRGVMLDISRAKVPTMDSLRLMVDRLAALKLNHLQLYMEHTFAYSEHQTVWNDASPLTSQDIVELDAYCRQRYIDLTPNQNSFGHMHHWLRHPEYQRLSECPEGEGHVLIPDQTSLDFLDGLYAELLPNFSSALFNVGCDETAQLGQGVSKQRCKKKGVGKVYLEFLKGIHQLVLAHGKRMMFWGDIILKHPELIGELPDDVIALNWGYAADHPFPTECRAFADARKPFYVCPGTSSWRSIIGRTGNCLGNLATAARNGLSCGAQGFLITDWGDGGHHQYIPVSYTGFSAGAAYSWCFNKNRNVDLAEAMSRILFQDSAGVLGRLFMEAGQAADTMALEPEARGPFSLMLMPEPREQFEELAGQAKPENLNACLERLEELDAALPTAKPAAPDGNLILRELQNGLDMARFGVQRTMAQQNGDEQNEHENLRRSLQCIVRRHRELWLERNRPGGLDYSLRRILETNTSLVVGH